MNSGSNLSNLPNPCITNFTCGIKKKIKEKFLSNCPPPTPQLQNQRIKSNIIYLGEMQWLESLQNTWKVQGQWF